jgi:hypothetical protein
MGTRPILDLWLQDKVHEVAEVFSFLRLRLEKEREGELHLQHTMSFLEKILVMMP